MSLIHVTLTTFPDRPLAQNNLSRYLTNCTHTKSSNHNQLHHVRTKVTKYDLSECKCSQYVCACYLMAKCTIKTQSPQNHIKMGLCQSKISLSQYFNDYSISIWDISITQLFFVITHGSILSELNVIFSMMRADHCNSYSKF